MKTFGELKKGDHIYYLDHGKLHEQEVIDVYEDSETRTFTDYFGQVHTQTDKFLVVKTKYRKYKLRTWATVHSTDIFYRMRRFACKEAANQYLVERMMRYNKKAKKAKADLEKYERLSDKYAAEAYKLSNDV